jgi:uncharacterized protein (TIGR00251 family)
MRIVARVKPNARQGRVIAWDAASRTVHVAVHAPPVDGKANTELERMIADILGCAPTRVRVAHGTAARTKCLEVPDDVDLERLAHAVR